MTDALLPTLARGQVLGDVEVVELLRSGGMASLFLGRRKGPSGFTRPVAIKVIHPHLAVDSEFVRAFEDEARLTALIHHRNVVHVEALGNDAGLHYLVMEYVDGAALHQAIRALALAGERLPVEVAVHIAMEVAAGLHAAHETRNESNERIDLVHRDVSPQNIMIGRDGAVKIIDFGIAKARGRTKSTTVVGRLTGKVRYMPPEQAWGRDTDRRVDVYALGVVLWELLTFHRLFGEQDDVRLLDSVRNPRVRAPSTLAPQVPPALDEVVLRALAPAADDRWPTAHAFRQALAQACPGALAVPPEQLAALAGSPSGEETGDVLPPAPRTEPSISPPTPAASSGTGPLFAMLVIGLGAGATMVWLTTRPTTPVATPLRLPALPTDAGIDASSPPDAGTDAPSLDASRRRRPGGVRPGLIETPPF